MDTRFGGTTSDFANSAASISESADRAGFAGAGTVFASICRSAAVRPVRKENP